MTYFCCRRGDCFGAMDWLERMQHDVEPDQADTCYSRMTA